MVSTGLFRATGVVLNRRTWRASCWRNMVRKCVGVVVFRKWLFRGAWSSIGDDVAKVERSGRRIIREVDKCASSRSVGDVAMSASGGPSSKQHLDGS